MRDNCMLYRGTYHYEKVAMFDKTDTMTSLIMCQSSEDLKFQANWDGAQGQSRQLLFAELSRKSTNWRST